MRSRELSTRREASGARFSGGFSVVEFVGGGGMIAILAAPALPRQSYSFFDRRPSQGFARAAYFLRCQDANSSLYRHASSPAQRRHSQSPCNGRNEYGHGGLLQGAAAEQVA